MHQFGTDSATDIQYTCRHESTYTCSIRSNDYDHIELAHMYQQNMNSLT